MFIINYNGWQYCSIAALFNIYGWNFYQRGFLKNRSKNLKEVKKVNSSVQDNMRYRRSTYDDLLFI